VSIEALLTLIRIPFSASRTFFLFSTGIPNPTIQFSNGPLRFLLRCLCVLDMTFGIQSPYTLARLPHPVADGFKGRFLAADVVSGSRKRKRPEVAVGIDGEGVNIYDVRLILIAMFRAGESY
jgi:hypothetical protein